MRAQAPIYVLRSLWDQLPDMSQVLAEMREKGMDLGGEGGDETRLGQPRLARDVSLRWDLFPEGVSEIPVTLTDPAGGVPAQIRRDDPSVTWRNYLTSWEEPAVKSITLPAGASARQLMLRYS